MYGPVGTSSPPSSYRPSSTVIALKDAINMHLPAVGCLRQVRCSTSCRCTKPCERHLTGASTSAHLDTCCSACSTCCSRSLHPPAARRQNERRAHIEQETWPALTGRVCCRLEPADRGRYTEAQRNRTCAASHLIYWNNTSATMTIPSSCARQRRRPNTMAHFVLCSPNRLPYMPKALIGKMNL